jgi:LysR family transcriptional regulator, nitrogen assimilation regulatory protein
MDPKQLAYFAKCAELGSVSRAAAALRVAQPAISRQIAALERELGTELLLRHGRGVTLTEAGEQLLGHAHDILERIDLARHEVEAVRGLHGGSVAFGMPTSAADIAAARLIRRFRARFPGAKLRVREGFGAHLQEWLAADRLDAAVMYDPPPSWGLSVEPVLNEDFCLIGPPDSPLVGDEAIPVAQALSVPLVLPSREHGLRRRIERVSVEAKIPLTVAVEVDSLSVIRELVAEGVGHSVLTPSSAEPELGQGRLRMARLTDPALVRTVALVTPRHRPLGRTAREAVHAARLTLQEVAREGTWVAALIDPGGVAAQEKG